MTRPRFHLAFPVRDIEETRVFYVECLGAKVGRSDTRWIDFDFWGHQISAHLAEDTVRTATNAVDGEQVPCRHFGVILDMQDWLSLERRLRSLDTTFLIEPQIRFQGEAGEQATMFLNDPSGNALEFKAFASDAQVFARE